MNTDVFISVVAPMRGDNRPMGEYIRALSAVLKEFYKNYEMILVDDLSSSNDTGDSRELLKEIECLRILRLSRFSSFDIGVTAGLESSIGDFVVVMDPETDPPEKIPEMVARAAEGIGLVVGVDAHPRKRGWLAGRLEKIFHWYVRRFLGVDLIPHSTNFQVLSRQVVNAVLGIKGSYRQLRFLTSAIGFRNCTLFYDPSKSQGSSPKKNPGARLWARASVAVDMLITNSVHPLRAVSLLGLGASVLNIIYLGYVIAVCFLKKDVAPGWASLSLQTGTMFFLLFLLLAILSEYVGRILTETRVQPLYNALDELNSSVLPHGTETRRNVVNESL